MKINLDTKVRLRLTPQGKLVVTYWIRKHNRNPDDYRDLLNSDVQEISFWTLISIFGNYAVFSQMQEEYFPDGIEIIEESK